MLKPMLKPMLKRHVKTLTSLPPSYISTKARAISSSVRRRLAITIAPIPPSILLPTRLALPLPVPALDEPEKRQALVAHLPAGAEPPAARPEGAPGRNRTGALSLTKRPLYHLSHLGLLHLSPRRESNPGPRPYQGPAPPAELRGPDAETGI